MGRDLALIRRLESRTEALARLPSFYQNLKYDLSESRSIRFQNFKIDVLGADNERLKYRIVSD